MSHGGKGSAQRPSQISAEQFDNNWEQIFGKKDIKSNSSDINKSSNTTFVKYILPDECKNKK